MGQKKGSWAKHRKRALALYGCLYKRHESLKSYNCIYCRGRGSEEDHLPPIVHVYDLGEEYFVSHRWEFLLVRSCSECNQLLGDKPLYTVEHRRMYLARRYDMRVHKRLGWCANWREEELPGLARIFGDIVYRQWRAYTDLCRWVDKLYGD